MAKKGEKRSKNKEKKSEKKKSKKTERKEEIAQKTKENKAKKQEKPFIMTAPHTVKPHPKGLEMMRIQLRPQKKNTSVRDANKFIEKTMKDLIQDDKENNRTYLYQVSYKLSNDRWYSGKFLGSLDGNFFPDFEQSVGGSGNINVDGESIETINILMKEINPLKKK